MKVDLGCGPNKKEGFIGVDQYGFDGRVDIVADLRQRWPFGDGEVEEVNASHFIEHLTAMERVFFANELYRVLKPGGQAVVVTPHWASTRAYGDPTHQWPPVSEMWFYYLNREWRLSQAPHTDASVLAGGFDCHFEATWGYGVHAALQCRNVEYQSHALTWWRDAATDIVATLTKRE